MLIKHGIIQITATLTDSKKVLMKFLYNLLFREIEKLTSELKKRYNLNFNNIKISNNKSNWRGCSNRGILSFNWRLVFIKPEILFYVVAYKMCHTVEMNHSDKFWSLVSNLCPTYKENKLWLKITE